MTCLCVCVCVCVCVCEEEASKLLQKRGKDRFKASKLHNFMLSIFFTKSKKEYVFIFYVNH